MDDKHTGALIDPFGIRARRRDDASTGRSPRRTRGYVSILRRARRRTASSGSPSAARDLRDRVRAVPLLASPASEPKGQVAPSELRRREAIARVPRPAAHGRLPAAARRFDRARAARRNTGRSRRARSGASCATGISSRSSARACSIIVARRAAGGKALRHGHVAGDVPDGRDPERQLRALHAGDHRVLRR